MRKIQRLEQSQDLLFLLYTFACENIYRLP